jgi:hypothetical protein
MPKVQKRKSEATSSLPAPDTSTSAEDDLRKIVESYRAELDDVKSALKKMKRRKKTTGVPQQINPYMFWSNVYQGGERKKVVAENGGTFNQTTNPTGISVSSAAKLLGERWRNLPLSAKDTFRMLRDDHVSANSLNVAAAVEVTKSDSL